MKLRFVIISGFLLCNHAKAQNLSPVSPVKLKIDSVRNFIYRGPSSDQLPPEFNVSALENEYYCDSSSYPTHVSVLRLRDNHTFIYENYYKPYNWARITFRIGYYRISGDSIYLTYTSLLPGKPGLVYVSPILMVSWIPPGGPEYLLFNKAGLFDPKRERLFKTLTDKPEFDLKKQRKARP